MPNLADTILKSVRAQAGTCVLYATPKLDPTPIEVLDGLEKDIDAPLPEEVRAFYESARQLGLVWQEETGKETSKQPEDWAALCNTDGKYWREELTPTRDYSKSGGMICIPTAAEVFRKGYWLNRIVPEPQGEELTIDGEKYTDAEVYPDIYPFDFITTYYCAALWFDRRNKRWRVILADDYGASWTGYKTISVADYLAQLVAGLGGQRHFISTWDEEKTIWALRKEE